MYEMESKVVAVKIRHSVVNAAMTTLLNGS